MQHGLDRGTVLRWLKSARLHRLQEPVEVIVQPEKAVAENMHDIIDGIRTGKAPVGDGNARFGERDIAAAHIGGTGGEGGCVHAAQSKASERKVRSGKRTLPRR